MVQRSLPLLSHSVFYLLRCFPFPRVRLASSGVVWGGLTVPFTPNLIIISSSWEGKGRGSQFRKHRVLKVYLKCHPVMLSYGANPPSLLLGGKKEQKKNKTIKPQPPTNFLFPLECSECASNVPARLAAADGWRGTALPECTAKLPLLTACTGASWYAFLSLFFFCL